MKLPSVERRLRAQLPIIRFLQVGLPLPLAAWLNRQGAARARLAGDITRTALAAGGVPGEWLVPRDSSPGQALLYLHGGGFVFGLTSLHLEMLAVLARKLGVRILAVDYRLAPAHLFPAPLDDCLAAYRWLLEQGIPARNIVVAGDSAGGNLTLTMTMKDYEGGQMLMGGESLPPLSGDKKDKDKDKHRATPTPGVTPTPTPDPYPLPETGQGGSFWEGVSSFFSGLLAWIAPAAAAHAATAEPAVRLAEVPAQIESGTSQVVIDYDYDPLNRLAAASYSNGYQFEYAYNAAGSVLTYTQNVNGQAAATSYSYDDAQQLVTAQMDNDPTVWHYEYDARGRLAAVTPGGSAGAGARRYTYSAAGYLLQVEAHDGVAYQTQAEMAYNGLGQRLAMTAYAGGLSASTRYALDLAGGAAPLAATANGETSFYLYGLGPVAEKQAEWSYPLRDGLGSARLATGADGAVLSRRSFTPWGEMLEQSGTGGLSWSYLGGWMDAATGLIYVGEGQYYDPATGRFLTRQAQPGKGNPYVPWGGSPMGALMGPLVLLAVMGWRKKGKKGGALERWLLVILVLLVAGGTLVACDFEKQTPTPTPPPTPVSNENPTQEPTVTVGSTPDASEAPSDTPAVTETCTPALPMPTVTIFFGGSWGQDRISEEGPDPTLTTLVWTQIADKTVRYTGNKKTQAEKISISEYANSNLVVIGYSAGADTALIFAYAYWQEQQEQGFPGRITDIAVLGGTMTGPLVNGGELKSEWPIILNDLLKWGTDIYVLDDDAAGGGVTNGYSTPSDATGTFFYDPRPEQEHLQGPFDGTISDLSTGTNNSISYREWVLNWIESY